MNIAFVGELLLKTKNSRTALGIFKFPVLRYKARKVMTQNLASSYSIPNNVPICQLDCKSAFDGLEEKEKKYAHYISKACNEGALICLLQTSPESPAIFSLFQKLFGNGGLLAFNDEENRDMERESIDSLLTYAAGFYSNMGNYKSFGDTKIVPAIPKEIFKSILWSSNLYQDSPQILERFWEQYGDMVFNLDKRHRELGIGEKGISTYYSSNIEEKDIDIVQEFMKEKQLSPYNTRFFKTTGENGVKFELRIASVAGSDKESDDDDIHKFLGKHIYKDNEIYIKRGDYAAILKRVNQNLAKAKTYASNEVEAHMLENYIKSFQYGSIDYHKDGSRYWIKNKGPIVETYIGFIESYRDPYGVRGEYEGFVSMVNKEMSAKFGELVDQAENLLKLLPWSADYEKDKFLRPDFTSLDVLSFASSGIPAGINIPNYDDIRQNEGFKNVSLGNVLQSHTTDQKVTFLSDSDQEMYSRLKGPSFEVQVGLHELLGHGSGKLFKENEEGTLNFDAETVTHLLTKEKIKSWYKNGETWDTKFSSIASTYEECRAECVGLLLCLDSNVLKIFGHEGENANHVLYINWLNMVRAGLLGLEFYSPESGSWKQAHMNARYVILQVLLEAGDNLVEIEEKMGDDNQPDLLIKLDESKIHSTGKKAISNFLMKLQLYKATADFENGQSMYAGYSKVGDDMLEKRKIVLARKQPRRMFVQSNTKINDADQVELINYPGSTKGLIQSFNERYLIEDHELEQLWEAEKHFHVY